MDEGGEVSKCTRWSTPVESPSAADDTEAPSMPRDRTCSDHTIMMLPQTLIAGVGTVKWTLVYKLHQPIKMYLHKTALALCAGNKCSGNIHTTTLQEFFWKESFSMKIFVLNVIFYELHPTITHLDFSTLGCF